MSHIVAIINIMGNVILMHEIIYFLKTTRTPGMLIKLDLSKAFDKLRWNCMYSVLSAFGFISYWIEWIMELTYSVFFSILVNGVPSKPFSPSQGTHQGDPLSPFLFMIMAEGLGRYLYASIANGTLQGLSIHGLQLVVSHNQFVDNTLLLNTPTAREVAKLQTILSNFNEASGTTFNLEKSQLFFFNMPATVRLLCLFLKI
jgi:hypothetical protein